MRRVLISVTQEDIDHARAELGPGYSVLRCRHCPVARAAMRALPDYAAQIAVGPDTIRLVGLGGYPRINLSKRAQDFILRFDNEQEVVPFKFYGTWQERA